MSDQLISETLKNICNRSKNSSLNHKECLQIKYIQEKVTLQYYNVVSWIKILQNITTILTHFVLCDLLQILHQNQPTIQPMLSALSQGEDLYQRKMYGSCKIQQNDCTVAHQIYNNKNTKFITENKHIDYWTTMVIYTMDDEKRLKDLILRTNFGHTPDLHKL